MPWHKIRYQKGTVATVNGIAITYNDVSLVEDELMAVYGQLPEEQRFQTLVGYMVNRILASEAAKKAGLENDADVAKLKAFMERKALQDVYIAKMLMERVREEDVTAYYDKEIKNGPVEEEVRARHICWIIAKRRCSCGRFGKRPILPPLPRSVRKGRQVRRAAIWDISASSPWCRHSAMQPSSWLGRNITARADPVWLACNPC